MKSMTQSNRRGWDRLAETHYRTYHLDKLLAGQPLLDDLIQREVGDVRGKSLVHLLCHIGSDTLSWALLGAEVTGIDISPAALKYARRLAKKMRIPARFMQADIQDVMDVVNQKFDVAFSSTGVLCWLPDIRRYARTVRHLLKDGGFFYLLDGHPFRAVLYDQAGEPGQNIIQGDYFRTQPWHYLETGDYTDPNLRLPIESYEWHWTLGDIVTAFCEAGLRIAFLHEFPRYFYNGYTPYDVESEIDELYPCTFSLKAVAEAGRG